MNKNIFSVALCVLFLALSVSAKAQQPTKIPRIGYLTVASISDNAARLEAFRQGLRDLGYIEGQNIVVEWQSAKGNADRLPELAAELVRLKVDVIVVGGTPPAQAAKNATATIPIVMANFSADPVAIGFVASLARPGGNITGLTSISTELAGKRLELLKEALPRLSRVIVVGTSTDPASTQALRETD